LDVDKHHVIAEYDKFFKSKQTASGDELQEVMLKVICDQPAAESAGASSPEFPCCWVIRQPTQPKVKIITTPDAQQVSSIDVHPMEKWIMTTNHVGSLRVWNYQTMTMLNSFELAIYEPVMQFMQLNLLHERNGSSLVMKMGASMCTITANKKVLRALMLMIVTSQLWMCIGRILLCCHLRPMMTT
jgi:hypothetical protein